MKKQRKWAIGILLCIVAVVLAVWVGAAKDEKEGDRESLYENEDYGLGFGCRRAIRRIRFIFPTWKRTEMG